MDLRKIKKLIELLEESGIAEIEIREGEESVRISRVFPASGPAIATVMPTPVVAPAAAASHAPPVATTAAPVTPDGHVVTSPMVGTFYRSAGPDKEPFVKVGDRVQKGQTICIIEAMKLFNEIEAEISGTVVDILIENAKPVEFDQPLFVVAED
mgnify:CR=1 FL=1